MSEIQTSLQGIQSARPPIPDRYHYVYSCDVEVNVKIKVNEF